MLDNQTRAQEQKIGIWQEDQSAGETPKSAKLTAATTMKTFDKYRDQSILAIVEYVRDAGFVNVVLKDNLLKLSIRLAGISAPKIPSKAKQEEGEKPEPFALEARFFVERHLLHRTINLTLTAPSEVNRPGEFYGNIELAGHTLASQLLRNGYAKLVEWSAPPSELESLKKCQEEAMTKKLRLWKYITAVEAAKESKKQWTGRVREIRDGAGLIIQDSLTDESKKVLLSNVKAPRLNNNDPYAYEVRELLRKKALGKKVTVVFDYSNNEKEYSTVFLEKTSLALILAEEGLCNITSYAENEKSSVYQELTIAENRAKAQRKNIWNKSAASHVYRVTDTSNRSSETDKKESKKKAQQFIGALQRAGRVSGIVEFVFGASRFKISIPSENCIVTFGLEAVRTPSNRESDKDPLGKEASDFSYEKLMQRDVEVIVENIDQAGNFFGSLFLNSKNFGITLLEMGYARINQSNVDYTNYANEYKAAEEEAKSKRIRIWANVQEQQSSDDSKASEESNQVRLFKVKISEVVDGNWFYLQMTDDAATLDKIMKELNAEDHPLIPNLNPQKGKLYCAKMPDNTWYRVRIEKFDKNSACVVCVDFGTGNTVNKNDLRPLSAKLASAPIQAKECHLAFLEIPSVGSDYGEEAAELFYNLVWGKNLLASLEYKEGEKHFVALLDGDDLINAKMAEAGFGVVPLNVRPRDQKKQNFVNTLKKYEEEAHRNRRGRWELGDFRDDDF